LPTAYFGPYCLLQRTVLACALPALVDRVFASNPAPDMRFLTIVGGRGRQLSIYLNSAGVREHLEPPMHLLAMHLQDLVALCIGRVPYVQCGMYATYPSRRDDDDSDRERDDKAKRRTPDSAPTPGTSKSVKPSQGTASGSSSHGKRKASGSSSHGKRKMSTCRPAPVPDVSEPQTQLLGLTWLIALMKGIPFVASSPPSREASVVRAAHRSVMVPDIRAVDSSDVERTPHVRARTELSIFVPAVTWEEAVARGEGGRSYEPARTPGPSLGPTAVRVQPCLSDMVWSDGFGKRDTSDTPPPMDVCAATSALLARTHPQLLPYVPSVAWVEALVRGTVGYLTGLQRVRTRATAVHGLGSAPPARSTGATWLCQDEATLRASLDVERPLIGSCSRGAATPNCCT